MKAIRETLLFPTPEDKIAKIAPFRNFKIQLETKDITTRLRGINLVVMSFVSSYIYIYIY